MWKKAGRCRCSEGRGCYVLFLYVSAMNRFLFLLMFLAFARPAFPAGQADSIAARIPALRGEERLQAYVSWCNLLAGETGHTAADELAAIRAYLAEA